ncbi:lysozyme, partial [Brevundimonas sp.]|uniref:lysozyme n=1 Tax=Brevundimonas sp. TaxID=1871086 RepID=UPI002ED78AD7
MLIKSFESFRPRAVQRDDGRWVIGYGHTASAREGLTVGEQDAELLLQYDLIPVGKALNEQVEPVLNQHQFDALASFAVSVGVDRFLSSDVLKRLNAGHAGEAADALVGWPEALSPDAALRRRAAERALFVADPAAPVLLADLLAQPLAPFPAVPEAVDADVPD